MRQFLLRALFMTWAVLDIASTMLAAEESQEFVDALRQRGMYETALAYLDRAARDPLVTDEFKQHVAYEQGFTLLRQARLTADQEIRERTLEQAREKLSQFATANQESLLGAKAQNHLGNLLAERGRTLVERADKLPLAQTAERESLIEQARQHFDNARVVFEATDQFYGAELKRFPVIVAAGRATDDVGTSRRQRSAAAVARQKQQELSRKRREFRSELVQSRMLVATVIYEKARSYPTDSQQRNPLLNEAADKYADLFEKYHRWLAGLYARWYQGRCYRELGELDKAIGCFEDLILQDSHMPVFRTLISKAHQAQAECYLDQKKYDKVIAKCGHWIENAPDIQASDPDWLGVKFQLAVAHQRKAAQLEQNSQRRRHEAAARLLVREVIQWPNDWRDEARLMVVSLGAVSPGSGDAEEAEPTTFDASFDAGKVAIETMGPLKLAVKLARQNNRDAVETMQQEITQQRHAAFRHFRRTVRLASDTSDAKKVVAAQSYLAYLNYEIQRYFDAAVLSEFVARNYADSASGRQAGQIALAAYQKLYFSPDNEDRDFESRRIMSVARYVIEQWPEGEEEATALRVLVDFALRAGDLDAARTYAAKLSPDRRAASLFQIGMAEWAQYVNAVRLEEAQRPGQAELSAMKARAQSSLAEGITQLRQGEEITPAVATAALYLAQIYLDTSQYEKAVAQLEDERFGSLSLIAKAHPAVASDLFVEEAYKAALRAYVSVQPAEREKAIKIMDAMEQRVAALGDAGGEQRITKIYIGLGRKLQTQLERLTAEGNRDEVQRVSAAFVDFLDRAGQRQTGNTWASRNWVAQTYYNLAAGGEGATGDGRTARGEQAEVFYGKSAAAYGKLLDEASADPGFSPSNEAVLGAKVRLAECLRRLGRYAKSLDLFAEVLAEKPNVLATQVAAAQTYQERGAEEDPKWYAFARNGCRKDKTTSTNRIWGWKKLAQTAYRYPKYRQIYFQSQYNNSLCRFKIAMQQSGNHRSDLLAKIEREVRSMDLLWTGETWKPWRPKYERLLKDVQRAQRK